MSDTPWAPPPPLPTIRFVLYVHTGTGPACATLESSAPARCVCGGVGVGMRDFWKMFSCSLSTPPRSSCHYHHHHEPLPQHKPSNNNIIIHRYGMRMCRFAPSPLPCPAFVCLVCHVCACPAVVLLCAHTQPAAGDSQVPCSTSSQQPQQPQGQTRQQQQSTQGRQRQQQQQ